MNKFHDVPMLVYIAATLFLAFALAPMKVWVWTERVLDRIVLWFAGIPRSAIGRCEAEDLSPEDGSPIRCSRLGVRIQEHTGHHYRNRFVCRDHGYEPAHTPPVIAILIGVLVLGAAGAARADNACYAICYEMAKPCNGRVDCNQKSGGCYDACDTDPPAPAPSLPPPIVASACFTRSAASLAAWSSSGCWLLACFDLTLATAPETLSQTLPRPAITSSHGVMASPACRM